MTVVSLPQLSRVTSPLSIAEDGDLVHVVSDDETAWWTATLFVEDGAAFVWVAAQSALCESVRRAGSARVLVFEGGALFEQRCTAAIVEQDRRAGLVAVSLVAAAEPEQADAGGDHQAPRT